MVTTGRQGVTNAFKFIGRCTGDVSRAVLDITGQRKIQYYQYETNSN
jgi:hypothetical protein